MHLTRRSLAAGLAASLLATGAARGLASGRAQAPEGARPVAIRIPGALVNAPIEPLTIPQGVMQEPTGVWTVGWYEESGGLGAPGPRLLYGYLDWWGVGPSVFAFLSYLVPGAAIELDGDDGTAHAFVVASVDTLPPAEALAALGEDPDPAQESLAVLAPALPYDQATGSYANLTLVRARRSDEPPVAVDEERAAPDALPCAVDALAALRAAGTATPVAVVGPMLAGAGAATGDQLADLAARAQGITSCDIGPRSALVLQDGTLVTLLGPPGALPLDRLTGMVTPGTTGVSPDAALCGFFTAGIEEDAGFVPIDILT